MNKTSISPHILQEVLDSASNAGAKGQAQYFTPVEWSATLARALNGIRPVIVDLTCGNGQLLQGAKHGQCKLLGCDLDSSSFSSSSSSSNFVPADLTRFYPLLKAVKFEADTFVLNPPWDLHWSRDLLSGLSASDCHAVAAAFAAHDGRTRRDTIDSTVATMSIALDLMSPMGEAFLIGNESTLQRLIFAKDAPHHALAAHVWAHLIIDGNICSPSSSSSSSFSTGVIYFARMHTRGMLSSRAEVRVPNLAATQVACSELFRDRLLLRKGSCAKDFYSTDTTVELWTAAAEEWARTTRTDRPLYNLFLDGTGHIRTYLSLFDNASGRVDKDEARKLHELDGKQPMQLVVQVAHRRALERAAFGTPGPDGRPSIGWRVDPALQQAVRDALADYNRVRAPLYPLPEIKRLGYLDEQELIECRKDIVEDGDVVFARGHHYPLRSITAQVNRKGTKVNIHGSYDEVEWDGQELAFFITDAFGVERCFMEARLRDPSVKVCIEKPGVRAVTAAVGGDPDNVCAIDHTLQELGEHFIIPEVPDVASLDPAGYQKNVELLHEIETLCT